MRVTWRLVGQTLMKTHKQVDFNTMMGRRIFIQRQRWRGYITRTGQTHEHDKHTNRNDRQI